MERPIKSDKTSPMYSDITIDERIRAFNSMTIRVCSNCGEKFLAGELYYGTMCDWCTFLRQRD